MTSPAIDGSWRRRFDGLPFLGLSILLAVSLVLGLGIGAMAIGPLDILSTLSAHLGLGHWREVGAGEQSVLIHVRLPRVVLAVLVGASLAVSGAALQGLFRNPLADPSLLGITGGATVAAAGAIIFGAPLAAALPLALAAWFLPLSAFIGAMVVTAIIYAISVRQEGMDIATLLLAGIAINAVSAAGLGLLTFLAPDGQLRDIMFWLLGSLAGTGWPQLWPVAIMILVAIGLIVRLARPLNALLLGEAEAFHVGFAIEPIKRQLVIVTALAAGAAVALTGTIGFVGLLVPHFARFLVGADHRRLLPASALLGASLLLIADLIGRLIVLPAELPIGVVTSFVGAPFFLWRLRRREAF
ncbi:FecCD family ABC transporter permease [Hypericibacter sp.]|uniref:FecCD family ABC transporter permease n=1 Tax=Hypericibacter sp. TaxID=2705401 RepID=UPI003D6D7E89